jgi:hypothetical protein
MLTPNIIFCVERKTFKFKYQFSDSNNNFWVHIIIFRIEISIFRFHRWTIYINMHNTHVNIYIYYILIYLKYYFNIYINISFLSYCTILYF